MAKVIVQYVVGKTIRREKEIRTTGDSAYIFDDIANELRGADGELKGVPKGTTEIVIRIPCEGY